MTDSLRPRAILLVDDDREVLRSLSRVLTTAGHRVETSSDPTAAVALLQREKFDAVISDISMPHLDGIQLLRSVRDNDRDLPVLLVTGQPSIQTAVEAVDYGAFKYLMKPVAPGELIQAVERATQVHRLARAKRSALELLGTGLGQASDRAGLEASFDSALSTLWAAFQPLVSASTRTIFGYEALMRSNEPSLPHPGAVLDAAERLGQLPRLGATLRSLVARSMSEADPAWVVFVNLHPSDLLDVSLFDPQAPLTAFADRVVLEITERASLDAISDVRGKISALRDLGYRIALDDLGAGYAGLGSFTVLEPDIVKLDMCLVRDIHTSPTKQKIVSSMTQLCREMKLLVVAEGVETAEERDLVCDIGCDLLQGYKFAKPAKPFASISW